MYIALEVVDIMRRRRTERAVKMAKVKGESCVFFVDKNDPELKRLIAAMCNARFNVDKLTDNYEHYIGDRSNVTELTCQKCHCNQLTL